MVIYDKQKETVINADEADSWLTLAMASTNAPFLSKQRTTSIWPARAAMCRAVSPRWCAEREHLWALRCCVKHFWEYLLGCCVRRTDGWKKRLFTSCHTYFWLLTTESWTNHLSALTMLRTSGDAPFCSRSKTMLRWPMKAATWMGVRPD